MKRVLLVSMPYGALERPSLGLSLLKAALDRARIQCDVRYLTFPFAELIGVNEYRWLTTEAPYTAFAGDWTFTSALYGERPRNDADYIRDVLQTTWRLSAASVSRIRQIRSLVPAFMQHCEAAVRWRDYAMVGFTSTFEQNIASLALARWLKDRHPRIHVVFGGANWEAEMGQELHRQFPFVDSVCSGESERSFPELARRVLRAKRRDLDEAPPGVVFRRGRESVSTGPPSMIRNLDELPIPDFGGYFRDLSQSTCGVDVEPTLLFESSRGCWWGAKSHCTFCGLNGGSMAFRSKSPRRAIAELDELVDRWRLYHVEAVDNILDMRYFRDVLPKLAARRRPVRLFYEVKANLSREQVGLLAAAGVHRIQPGIESLSDHILKLMRKGTTALRNIQLLKWCQEYGVGVDWNLLYGFPGETREDYAAMIGLLPAIRHLPPPGACGPIRMDRFSPYYNAPAEFGMTNVRPLQAYRVLYPFDAESLQRIAYFFDYDYAPEIDPRGFADDLIQQLDEWRRSPERGTLRVAVAADGSVELTDTRRDATIRRLSLSGLEAAAYEYCDEMRSARGVTQHLGERFPSQPADEAGVRGFFDSLVANRLMVTDGERYLAVALHDRSTEFTVPEQPAASQNVVSPSPPMFRNGSLPTVSCEVL